MTHFFNNKQALMENVLFQDPKISPPKGLFKGVKTYRLNSVEWIVER